MGLANSSSSHIDELQQQKTVEMNIICDWSFIAQHWTSTIPNPLTILVGMYSHQGIHSYNGEHGVMLHFRWCAKHKDSSDRPQATKGIGIKYYGYNKTWQPPQPEPSKLY